MKKFDNHLPSLESLQEKIDQIKRSKKPSCEATSRNDMSQAMRLSIDLVAGVAVGITGGYLLDSWLGTVPLCMIVGLFLGMAAGVRNMLRSAAVMDRKTKEEDKLL